MPNTVRLHRVLAMKREKVYRAFIEPDPMVPTWQPGHFQAAPLWQPVGRSGLTVLSNVRCRQLRCVAALGRSAKFATVRFFGQISSAVMFYSFQIYAENSQHNKRSVASGGSCKGYFVGLRLLPVIQMAK
jgi:hypothetical protein